MRGRIGREVVVGHALEDDRERQSNFVKGFARPDELLQLFLFSIIFITYFFSPPACLSTYLPLIFVLTEDSSLAPEGCSVRS
jgi:hypothetical protein